MLSLFRRELGYYWRADVGATVMALTLFIDGLLFNAIAVGTLPRRSSQVLEDFFYLASGPTMLAAVLLSMRLLAEERQRKTLVLLSCSALAERDIVLAKFLAAYAFLAATIVSSAYMPALVLWHGNVALGHVVAGYVGLLLLGAASLAIGLLASALAASQLFAALLAACALCVATALWRLAPLAGPPLGEVLAYLALHDRHFRPTMHGILDTGDAVYYLSVTAAALSCATRVLETRRWR